MATKNCFLTYITQNIYARDIGAVSVMPRYVGRYAAMLTSSDLCLHRWGSRAARNSVHKLEKSSRIALNALRGAAAMASRIRAFWSAINK